MAEFASSMSRRILETSGLGIVLIPGVLTLPPETDAGAKAGRAPTAAYGEMVFKPLTEQSIFKMSLLSLNECSLSNSRILSTVGPMGFGCRFDPVPELKVLAGLVSVLASVDAPADPAVSAGAAPPLIESGLYKSIRVISPDCFINLFLFNRNIFIKDIITL